MLARLLAASLALTSLSLLADAAPIHTRLAARLHSDLNPPPRVRCSNPITTYLCPSNVETLPSPEEYLSCGLPLPEPASPSLSCLYKAYASFELVNYKSDGSFDPTRGSDPQCDRWSRAITTCGSAEHEKDLLESVGGICEGEQTEHSCPDGYALGQSSETDFECISSTSTCYYYADSGLKELFYLDASWDGSEGYEDGEGCPDHARNATTCERVQSWRTLIDAL